jgi:integrase-like protein
MIEAFPDDAAPRWRLRDRDAIYGDSFRRRVAGMGMGEVLSSPSSAWQNPYAERLIGSFRRECLDHVIILGERHLGLMLTNYVTYYHGARTHLSLVKDAPAPRRAQASTAGDVDERWRRSCSEHSHSSALRWLCSLSLGLGFGSSASRAPAIAGSAHPVRTVLANTRAAQRSPPCGRMRGVLSLSPLVLAAGVSIRRPLASNHRADGPASADRADSRRCRLASDQSACAAGGSSVAQSSERSGGWTYPRE